MDIDDKIEAEAEEDSKSSSLGRRLVYLWHVLSHRLGFARHQVPLARFKALNNASGSGGKEGKEAPLPQLLAFRSRTRLPRRPTSNTY